MSVTSPQTGRQPVLQSAGYPRMTNTITNSECSIHSIATDSSLPPTNITVDVYELSYSNSPSPPPSSPYCINTASQSQCATRGITVDNLQDVHSDNVMLHFVLNTSSSFQGRFWIGIRGNVSNRHSFGVKVCKCTVWLIIYI